MQNERLTVDFVLLKISRKLSREYFEMLIDSYML